jgi:hypothetical protein
LEAKLQPANLSFPYLQTVNAKDILSMFCVGVRKTMCVMAPLSSIVIPSSDVNGMNGEDAIL